MIARAPSPSRSRSLVPLGAAAQDSTVSILYLARDGDPTYEDRREYAGLGLPPPVPPIEGAQVAIAEAKILGRALKLRIELEERRLAEGEDAVAAVAAAGPRAVLLDLPLADVEAVAAALGDATTSSSSTSATPTTRCGPSAAPPTSSTPSPAGR